MPRIEAYPGDRVRTQPIQRPRVSPEEFGSEFGQALGGMAREAARIEAEVDERATDLAAMTAERRFNELDTLTLYAQDVDPRPLQEGGTPYKGLLNQQGRAPQDNLQATHQIWDEQAEQIVAEAKTPSQRRALELMRVRRRAAMQEQTGRHAANEFQQYRKTEWTATLGSTHNTGVAAVGREGWRGVVENQLLRQTALIDQHAQEFGLGPEAAADLKRKMRSNLHVGVVTRLVEQQQDIAANAYYEEMTAPSAQYPDGQIEGDKKDDLDRLLERSSTDGLATRDARAIWEQHKPTKVGDPVNMTVMMEAARERAGGDRTRFEKARQFLNEFVADWDVDARQTRGATNATVWRRVADLTPGEMSRVGDVQQAFAAVRALPEYQRMEPTDRLNVDEYFGKEVDRIKREADQAESRAYTAESRRYQRETRDYQRQERAEAEVKERQYERYFELSTPANLAMLSEDEIATQYRSLGPTYTAALIKDKREALSNPGARARQEIQREDFQQIAYDAGLDYAYTNPRDQTRTQKAKLGQLLAAVNLDISQQAAALKRPLTREETRAAMSTIVNQTVLLNTWGSDERVIRATVLQDEAGLAYVELDEIPTGPDSPMERMLNYLRTMPDRAGTAPQRRPNDDQLKMQYGKRLKRAYGATLMGATEDEANAILKGER